MIALNAEVCRVIEDWRDHHRHDVEDEYGREPLLTSRNGRMNRASIRDAIYRVTRPCYYANECPKGRDLDECEAGRYPHYSKCPANVSPHAIRRGSITHFLSEDVPEKVVSDRMNVGQEVLDKHYDKRTEEQKVEQRRPYLSDLLFVASRMLSFVLRVHLQLLRMLWTIVRASIGRYPDWLEKPCSRLWRFCFSNVANDARICDELNSIHRRINLDCSEAALFNHIPPRNTCLIVMYAWQLTDTASTSKTYQWRISHNHLLIHILPATGYKSILDLAVLTPNIMAWSVRLLKLLRIISVPKPVEPPMHTHILFETSTQTKNLILFRHDDLVPVESTQ